VSRKRRLAGRAATAPATHGRGRRECLRVRGVALGWELAISLPVVLGVLAGLLVAAPGVAAPTGPRVARIGMLFDDATSSEPLRQRLRELGYVEGKTILFEERGVSGRTERWPELVADLIRLRVDVIVARNTPATLAAKRATATIPIVMAGTGDPVRTGLVASLARPGGNVTGVAFLGAGLAAKRLELLREAVPGLTRVALYWNPTNPANRDYFNEARAAAETLGVTLQSIQVPSTQGLEDAFTATRRMGAAALLVTGDPVVQHRITEILAFAANARLPAMYNARENVEAGGLMSYGASRSEIARRAADYIDRILRGGRPEELPVEQPTQLELVVNLKTARALGMTFPRGLLLRTDHVVR
jgi:putative ABC transport system substrate-binding protein